jgi:hypothetical protein
MAHAEDTGGSRIEDLRTRTTELTSQIGDNIDILEKRLILVSSPQMAANPRGLQDKSDGAMSPLAVWMTDHISVLEAIHYQIQSLEDALEI